MLVSLALRPDVTSETRGLCTAPPELHMTKPRRWDKNNEVQNFCCPLLQPLRLPSQVPSGRAAGGRPTGSVPFHKADGSSCWQTASSGAQSPERRDGGESGKVSARLLSLTRTKIGQKTKETKKGTNWSRRWILSSLKVPVSFKCFCFSCWSLQFHFFCTFP